jgi:hypothetical protein
MSIFSSLISPITNLVGTHLKNKAEEKLAKHTATLRVIDNDASWENKMAEASSKTWKDEYSLILVTSPVVLIMYGALTNDLELIARVQSGFTVLGTLPVWFQYLLGLGLTTSFGIKGAKDFMSLRGK